MHAFIQMAFILLIKNLLFTFGMELTLEGELFDLVHDESVYIGVLRPTASLRTYHVH